MRSNGNILLFRRSPGRRARRNRQGAPLLRSTPGRHARLSLAGGHRRCSPERTPSSGFSAYGAPAFDHGGRGRPAPRHPGASRQSSRPAGSGGGGDGGSSSPQRSGRNACPGHGRRSRCGTIHGNDDRPDVPAATCGLSRQALGVRVAETRVWDRDPSAGR